MTGNPRMRSRLAAAVAAVATLHGALAWAADFDGSKRLMCAPVQAMDCAVGEGCTSGLPADVGAPAFMRIDFRARTIVGPHRTTPILLVETTDAQLLLQGRKLGLAWSIALDREDGRMSATLVSRDAAIVLFGSCTPY